MATTDKSTKTKNPNKKATKHKLYLSPNAVEILEKRYLKRDESGKPTEKSEDMFWRVAEYIAQAEANYEKTKNNVKDTAVEFYNLMVDLDFLPNSPTLRGAGRSIHQLSGCFVLPVEDSMEGIFNALKNMALVHKGGGGTGFSFGRLRPAGAHVGSTKGVAGGPLSFMQIFNTTGGELMQGGTRVGANMGILPVHHPDILAFIDAKQDNKSYQNFNLSVAITDDFMKKVESAEDYDLINPKDKKKVGKLNAKEVFEKMVHNAWKTGDPGIIFIDRINRDNATPKLGEIESTNPCGEQPLLPYESCNLGSINLSNMLKGKEVNWDHLKETTHKAVHFLDNVIDMNNYVVPEIEEMTKGNRKIGLGVMGWADMLIRMGIPYNSEEAIKLAEKIMKFINNESHKASRELAQVRGVFPHWDKSIWFDKKIKIRNAAITTIAPTGTLSMIGNCSGGVEPLFAVAYSKKSLYTKEGTAKVEQFFVNPLFEYYAKKDKFWSDELVKKVAKTNSIQDIQEIPLKWRNVFVTSHDISPEWHIKMQAAFQKYTENAVSKTINFPNEATIDDIRKTYLLSYKLGCKGITIYRDGSKDMQVFTTESTYKKDEPKPAETLLPRQIEPRKRPKVVRGVTEKMKTGCGSLYVTINFDEQGPFEVFTAMGKAGGCASSQLEALSRILSSSLRAGLSVKEIINQMKAIRCPSPIWQDGELILSCSDAIAKVLENHCVKIDQPKLFENGEDKLNTLDLKLNKEEEKQEFLQELAKKQPGESNSSSKTMATCPDCGASLEHKEGCLLCNVCGFSKCG
ncbi:MAG TPA: vitamin B12-dependent ribonucleotide reductase [Patescibacteria group bacterium]|nr:vitamin B12-dependent ribonucleotide reductase [Patescibacteria group bacterium]